MADDVGDVKETAETNHSPLVSKGRSPFYPGQPVPVELFAGRGPQIDRIMERGVGQVAQGKPIAMYVQGEYGIGKSSIAGFCQWLADREGLHPIYAPLGAAQSMADVGAVVLEATIRSGALESKRSEIVRSMLAKYIGEQSLFGVTIHAEQLKADAPSIASGMLPFLDQVYERLKDDGVRGIFLVLDEIDGIASNPQFGHFIKGLVDTNAMSARPVPLLLMLCGVEDRRREMIRHHQPVDRIFDVIEIDPMSQAEMEAFFLKAFESVQMTLDPSALRLMTHYGGGFPKILHLIGDAAFWIDKDLRVDETDVMNAVFIAADEVGQKFVEQQVYKALRSSDYRSIFNKIARTGLSMKFTKADIAKGLNESEQRKLNNFLQKMKLLKVIRSGDSMGEYVFTQRMVRMYIWLESKRTELGADAG